MMKKSAALYVTGAGYILRSGVRPLLAALLLLANIASAFQVDFSKEAVEELFEGNLPAISQGMAILPERIETRALPIEAGKKYKLQMTAQVDGDFVVEENDRAHIETLHRDNLGATYKMRFYNDSGEEVSPLGRNAAWTGGFFLTKNAHPYVMVFYAPEGATNLKVNFQSNGRTACLSNLKLAEETEEGTLNVNPDFRYGELNYCGWKPSGDGRLYQHPDGKSTLNAGFHYFSPFFPLNPKNTYHVSAIGEGGEVNIDYFDENLKFVVQGRFLIRLKPEGMETEFTPPEGTVMGRVTGIRSPIIQEIRIMEYKK